MLITPTRGFIELRRRYRGDSSHQGETFWFSTFSLEFGLWLLAVHAFGLVFTLIGPFQWRRDPKCSERTHCECRRTIEACSRFDYGCRGTK